jgi:hypothetical protein
MTARQDHSESLRPGRFEFSRLGWALILSLMIHAGGYGGYKVGEKLNLWQSLRLPSWMRPPLTEKKKEPVEEMPLMFVDVNPRIAVPDPPKDAKFYSSKNSEAANPEPDRETGQPKITGKQTDIVKAEDVELAPLDRLQPAFPRPEKENVPERARPSLEAPPGDLAMARPDDATRPNTGTAEQARPRTIREALLRQNRNQIPGQKMFQEGGVPKLRIDPGFDVKATSFGAYDEELIDAVTVRWYQIMGDIAFDGFQAGEVELSFRLHYDGRATDVKIINANVGLQLTLACQRAVSEPAPFGRWSTEMRKSFDKDYRDLHWKFYYRLY